MDFANRHVTIFDGKNLVCNLFINGGLLLEIHSLHAGAFFDFKIFLFFSTVSLNAYRYDLLCES